MNNKQLLISLINDRKTVKTEAVTTSAGEQTTTYLDIPGVLADNDALKLATQVLFEHIIQDGRPASADIVVGPITGSIPLVMGLATHPQMAGGFKWSIIRDDEVKDHGLQRGFVGATPGPGDKVVLVDDVASSGQSLVDAYERIMDTGSEVLAIVPLVDRGDRAEKLIRANGRLFRKLWPALETVPYLPVLTYKDLGIEAL